MFYQVQLVRCICLFRFFIGAAIHGDDLDNDDDNYNDDDADHFFALIIMKHSGNSGLRKTAKLAS